MTLCCHLVDNTDSVKPLPVCVSSVTGSQDTNGGPHLLKQVLGGSVAKVRTLIRTTTFYSDDKKRKVCFPKR